MRGQAGAGTLVYDADEAVGGGGGGGAGGAHLPTLEYDAVAVAAPVAAPLTGNGAASKAAAQVVHSKGDEGNSSAPGNP
jgi:hypothetical protein